MSNIHYLIGYRTDRFVILVSDKVAFQFGALKVSDGLLLRVGTIVIAFRNLDASKEYQLGDNMYMTVMGEAGDADNFGDWAKRNIYLYKLRHNYELRPQAAHHWLRKSIADNLRTEDFWRVNLLIGGFDKVENRAYLGACDYLGNAIGHQVCLQFFNVFFRLRPFAFAFAELSFPRLWRPFLIRDHGLALRQRQVEARERRSVLKRAAHLDATVEEAMAIIKKCIAETNRRFIAHLPAFSVLVIDEQGAHQPGELIV